MWSDCVCACVCACVHVCVCTCVHACVCARACVSVCVLEEMGPSTHSPGQSSSLSFLELPSHLFIKLMSPEG